MMLILTRPSFSITAVLGDSNSMMAFLPPSLRWIKSGSPPASSAISNVSNSYQKNIVNDMMVCNKKTFYISKYNKIQAEGKKELK